MSAPVGNQFAVGHGRPRDLSREAQRIVEASRHIEALAQQAVVAAVLGGRKPDMAEIDRQRRARAEALAADVRHLLAAVARMEENVGALDRLPRGRRGKRRRGQSRIHTPSKWAVDIATAAAALDRLVGEGTAQ